MENREKMIKEYFQMWISKNGENLTKIFDKDILYIESYGPVYNGIDNIISWFNKWSSINNVFRWEIKQFVHTENQTIVEWYFEYKLKDKGIDSFDGVSIIKFKNEKISYIKEFACVKGTMLELQ
ncbi:nuclear transport factor 2 family protein [Oceanivirga salmonicida]|uniref:nuclear transport factor 2 family protein n=1 Tax=Oceanivirga salmonicida TaxID=1769291 RepID=UPI00083218F9|nr:nuclear transport factor 2 family protein [Oceanivirga salmonicida]